MPDLDYYLMPNAAWQGLLGLGLQGAHATVPNLIGLITGEPAPPLANPGNDADGENSIDGRSAHCQGTG